jgi:hypothetical protein
MSKRKKKSSKWTTYFGAIVLIGLVMLFIGGDEDENTPTSDTTSNSLTSATDIPKIEDQSSSLDVETDEPVLPTNTPPPSPTQRQETALYIISDANARSCAEIDNSVCPVVMAFSAGDELTGVEEVEGDTFNGSDIWWEIDNDGEIVYVHSELVSTTRSTTVQSSNTGRTNETSGDANNSISNDRPPAATAAPAATRIPRPQNCTEAVEMGLTAEQAAQWSHLDRDGDGVACYGD